MPLNKMEHLDADARNCVETCLEAVEASEWCSDACAGMGEEMAACVRLCRDVADLTALHARLIVRDSPYREGLSQVCADACEACAEECASFDHDHCQVCANVLEDCAQSCRTLLGT